MNASIGQQNKSLGIKLFGHIASTSESNEVTVDVDQTYEIHLFPGEAPIGEITHLRRNEQKKIIVEVPEKIRQKNFETICSFLLEKNGHLLVKEYGFEKLKNRKLLLDLCYDSREPIVNVLISIQGKTNSINYEIELNPYDISSSLGEIQRHGSQEYEKSRVFLKELKNIENCHLKKILPKFKPNNFDVGIDQDGLVIDLAAPLKQYIESLGKPTKYQRINNVVNPISVYAEPDEIAHPKADERSPVPIEDAIADLPSDDTPSFSFKKAIRSGLLLIHRKLYE